MGDYLTPRIAVLSALYALLLIPLALGLNYAFGWFTDNVLISLINWFNHQNFFLKVLLFVFGGYTVLIFLFRFFKFIGNLLSLYIFLKLPDNWFTVIFSTVLYILNTGWNIYVLWEVTPRFSAWIVLEFLLLCFFILSINTILIPWYIKGKVEKDMRQRAMAKHLEYL